MPDRPAFRTFEPCRVSRLLAALLFLLALFGGPRLALAARVPAPMCTPDAQSMDAPLQRTPTSAAEIKRGAGCPTLQGPGWEISPTRRNLPADWYLPVADPLWVSQTVVKAARAPCVSLMLPVEPPGSDRMGFSNEIFRPPILSLSPTQDRN